MKRTSTTIEKIMPAYVKALGQIKAIQKETENPFLKNKYVSLDQILESARPILSGNDLSTMQTVSNTGVETFILHASGEWIASGELLIQPQEAKGLSYAQSLGVATTYAKRYQLGAMLGISAEEDSDGNHGDNKGLKSVDKKQETSKLPAGSLKFDEAIANEILLLTDLDGLEKYWKQLKELQNDPAFKKAINDRKTFLLRADTQYERRKSMLDACLTVEDVGELSKNNPDFPQQLINDRIKEIKTAKK